MPLKKKEKITDRILEEIKSNFQLGERFHTIRKTADLYGVSLQTAQKIISQLKEEGILETRDRSGVFIKSLPGRISLSGKKILLLSGNHDPRFVEAFSAGIHRVTDPLHIPILYIPVTFQEHNTIAFGEYIISLYKEHDASGAFALVFRNAELAFYHALNHNCLIISDVSFPNLPFLPSVQSDNKKHVKEAAQRFFRLGKKEILVCSYWEKDNIRFRAFKGEIERLSPDIEIKFVYLKDETSPADLYLFFRHFHTKKAVFSLDYATNHTITPYFVTHHISPHNNYIVYDNENNYYNHPGLPPIESAAPSLEELGIRLAEKLITRMETGVCSEPVQEMM